MPDPVRCSACLEPKNEALYPVDLNIRGAAMWKFDLCTTHKNALVEAVLAICSPPPADGGGAVNDGGQTTVVSGTTAVAVVPVICARCGRAGLYGDSDRCPSCRNAKHDATR